MSFDCLQAIQGTTTSSLIVAEIINRNASTVFALLRLYYGVWLLNVVT